MSSFKPNVNIVVVLVVEMALGSLSGCSWMVTKSPAVSDNIRRSLDQNGLKQVSVSQDRDKGIVTLSGNVTTAQEKAQAENLANGLAGGQVVADEIAVLPAGHESAAAAVNSDLDAAIGKNLDAALIQSGLKDRVTFAVKTGVVTLTGTVRTRAVRFRAEQIAKEVPNVQQVVNAMEIRDQKATSSK